MDTTPQVDYSGSSIPDKEFTLEELAQYTGASETEPVYLGIAGLVFDVSAKREMYSGESGYKIFAGKDATRGLAKSSLEVKDLEPFGVTTDLSEKEQTTLKKWQAFYRQRYPCVGKIPKH
jgi:predicted heme/steroid binding protein